MVPVTTHIYFDDFPLPAHPWGMFPPVGVRRSLQGSPWRKSEDLRSAGFFWWKSKADEIWWLYGDLTVIQWFNNGLTMVNNGMIWDLASGQLAVSYWTWPIEIVDLPNLKMVIFHSKLLVY